MNDFEIPSSPVSGSSPTPRVKATDLQSGEMKPDSKAEETKEAPQWPVEELLRVFDEIIFSGEYTEQFNIRDRLVVKFRTRTAEELNEIQAQLDSSQFNLITTVEQKRSILLLEKALIYYNGKDLSVMKPSDKTVFIGRLPGPIVGALLNALQRFDDKVFAACKEGEKNF